MSEEQKLEKGNRFESEAAEILQRALERPGVREMMSVYGQWEWICAETQAYRQAIARKRVIVAADTSDRTVLRMA
ncbi:MAG TPA: hypothetical protein PKH24_05350 [Sedimentisphaerales bacterium]|jgi:hypothetical protein|nr:hypothetical protein [Sedimentisphaerales bacterium]HNU29025.1 hypothetical protein [Sedimentisphaerales bacterium]